MKAVEFAYWLQGYFEIEGGNAALSGNQLRQIAQKADKVAAGNDAAEQSAKSYVDYVRGALSLLPASGAVDTGMAEKLSGNMRTKLNDLFIHAIDPTIEGDQKHFREVHRPDDKKPGGGLVAMC